MIQIKTGQQLQPIAGSTKAANPTGDAQATEVASAPKMVETVAANVGVPKKPPRLWFVVVVPLYRVLLMAYD